MDMPKNKLITLLPPGPIRNSWVPHHTPYTLQVHSLLPTLRNPLLSTTHIPTRILHTYTCIDMLCTHSDPRTRLQHPYTPTTQSPTTPLHSPHPYNTPNPYTIYTHCTPTTCTFTHTPICTPKHPAPTCMHNTSTLYPIPIHMWYVTYHQPSPICTPHDYPMASSLFKPALKSR